MLRLSVLSVQIALTITFAIVIATTTKMLFKITCENDSVYYYDNMLSIFYDQFMNLIEMPIHLNSFKNRAYNTGSSLKNDEYFQYHASGVLHNGNKVYNPSKTHRLEIAVGFKCNYRCKYCVQSYCHTDTSGEFDFSKFRSSFEKSGLLPNLSSLKLTGGEPLLYFDRVKTFVTYFRQECGFTGKISVVTNGELFSEEVLNFCLENDVFVFFSHDAYAQTCYRHKTDYLDDPKKRELVIRQLKVGQYDFGLSSSGAIGLTLNPKVYNLEKALDWLNDRLYEGVPVCPYLVTEFDSHTAFMLDEWTEETIEEAKRSFLHAYIATKDDKYFNYYYRFRETLERALYRYANQKPAATQLGRCPVQISSGVLAVDYNGNAISCWGTPYDKKIVDGNLGERDKIVYHYKTQKDTKDFCKSCPYILSCGGNACPMLNEKSHEIKCKSLYPFLGAQAEAAFALILGSRVKEIEPCVQ